MSNKQEELLKALFDASIEVLLERARNGEITASELAVVRNLCKDNGIGAIPTKDNSFGQLLSALEREYEEQMPVN